ncbi:MAG: rod shape-determining protein RodA [Deltaproteobacteria bacterium HGW-Deltaproteobacteria-7]|jgi:rod shape determining protein RodA|nr:MAG: rod shape-determining protein RodA [Deltaproteobacteria bacterium HGW-Deltaproteobacteria-7]PKN18062.1 MAG: rod shape-determining protein RodA [Deltaproteobacteria bacterium HGW-Deltaproteobacteria-6]
MIFFKYDRRIFQNFDWTLCGLVLAICAIGIINIYSTGFSLSDNQSPLYLKQLQWILFGLFLMMITFLIDYRAINQAAYIIYAISVLSLIVVALFGHTANGAQRWISFGFVLFQPSELMKVSVIIVLARYFDDHKSNEPYLLRELFVPAVMVLFPCVLILKQPDLGTALMIVIVAASIVLFIGMNWKSLLITAVSILVMLPMAWFFLKDYQKDRLLTFLSPEIDPLGTGYHIIQSMIAIGSGGFLGKGFLKGSQTQLKFLPEQQTDFVFSVFAEEWGFVGGLILMMMFISLIIWGLKIALHSKDLLGTILAFGITVLIAWQVVINMGMVLGMLPVVGIPLPFLSYGGSAIVSLLAAIGLLMNVSVRRFILQR